MARTCDEEEDRKWPEMSKRRASFGGGNTFVNRQSRRCALVLSQRRVGPAAEKVRGSKSPRRRARHPTVLSRD